MNIFYLHKETKKCAEMHLDKHCVKMILEYAQLLSTVTEFLTELLLTKSLMVVRKNVTFLITIITT